MSRAEKKASKKNSRERTRKTRVNFSSRVRYDKPVFDRGQMATRDRPENWDDFDEIAGNFGDWGSQ